jgi:Tfp pilus assembly major pilin PilA
MTDQPTRRDIAATTRAHCNNCGGDRKHDVLHVESTCWEDNESHVEGGDRYEMLRCAGCEQVKLRHTSTFSEDDEPTVVYYPPSEGTKAARLGVDALDEDRFR